MDHARPLIGVTMGDPAGIGPEVCLKMVAHPRAHELCRSIIIGDTALLQEYAVRFVPGLTINSVNSPGAGRYLPGVADILDLANVDRQTLPIGQVSARAGAVAAEYIKVGARLALSGEIDGLLTGPANKEAIDLAGYHYAGQAEFFQELTGASQFTTMLLQGNLRVGLLTTHLSLANACAAIKKERILRYLEFIHNNRLGLGLETMKIGVAALNPHGGDGGLFGREEIDEISPAIAEARAKGIDANGPIPAQDVFRQAARGKWDVVLAMFHDQAAIAMDINNTTTLTLGLPILRTSVGHGTAFDIAGKGLADAGPMLGALDDTTRLATYRRQLAAKEAL